MAAGDSIMRQVTSRDGATIAYWTSGKGLPLVVVHGTPAYTRWTVGGAVLVAMGRNTRLNASSRTSPRWWMLCRGVRVRRQSLRPLARRILCIWCCDPHANIRKLVLYKGWPVLNPGVFALPTEIERRIDAFLAAGDRDAVVGTVFRHYELMSDEDMKAFKAAPSWPGRVAAAHTIIRECRAEANARLDPAMAARIAVPTLLLIGEHSADPYKAQIEAVAAALPNARIVVIEGQEHVADGLAPKQWPRNLCRFCTRALKRVLISAN